MHQFFSQGKNDKKKHIRTVQNYYFGTGEIIINLKFVGQFNLPQRRQQQAGRQEQGQPSCCLV